MFQPRIPCVDGFRDSTLVLAVALFGLGVLAAPRVNGQVGVPDEPPCGGSFPAIADASVDETQPAANLGGGPIWVSRTAAGGEQRGLARFDLTPIAPAGATIYGARLELTLYDVAGTDRYTLSAHEARGDWSEASVNWSSRPTLGDPEATVSSAQRVGTIAFDVTMLVRRRFLEGASELSFFVVADSPGLCTFHERTLSGGGADPEGPRLIVSCAPTVVALPADPADGDAIQSAEMDRLRSESRVPLSLRVDRGVVRFASFDLPVPSAVGTNRLAQAEWLLDSYSGLLQRSGQSDSWQLLRRSPDGRILVFRQVHDGVPVFPAEVSVFLGDGSALSIGGDWVPEIQLPAVQRISREEAEELALASARDSVALNPHPLPPGIVGETQLRYVDLSLLGLGNAATHLAWRVNVALGAEQVGLFIDAMNGALLYTQRRASDSFDLELKTRNGAGPVDWNCWAPGAVLLYDENGKVVSSPPAEATTGFGNIKATYDYYRNILGRDSWDNSGRKIEMHINVNFPKNARYASWCDYIEFGTGMATLDTVGHEFTHGIVHHTSDLEYVTQSGALNESFADIFGHFVDNTNWTIGEGSAAGTLRDMRNPPNLSDPDHVDKSVSGDGLGLRTLANGVNPECDPKSVNYNDCGFVHTNSSIQNKVAYLVVAGGTHNGRSIPAVGQKNAEQLFYLTLLGLNSHSQLIDARDRAVWQAWQFATQPWYKPLGFTSKDACAVQNAYASVGLGSGDADCDGIPDNAESDADGDSVPDSKDNCRFIWNAGQSNIDSDGLGDACDPDTDGDSIPNLDQNGKKLDNCPLLANTNQKDWDGDKVGDVCDDSDGDGVSDALDRCRTVFDPTNKDTDGDGIGDVCDPDIDGDLFANAVDNCPYHYNPQQFDSDGDKVGDACDLCPGVSSSDNGDPDMDGLGNPCDDDDDGDGVLDVSDNCRLVPNPDQRDDDKNGIGFACDSAEQIAWLVSKILRSTLRLEIDPRSGIGLPVCPSCGDRYLPDGFVSHVSVEAPIDVRTRIVDSNGATVARGLEGGKSHSMIFQPAPFAITKPIVGPGAGGGGGLPAGGDWGPDAQTHYFLEVEPVGDFDPAQSYTVDLEITDGKPTEFVRGDVNVDRRLDLADAISLLSFLFTGGVAPRCDDSADINDDGRLDIADPIRLLNYLFAGAAPPPGAPSGTRQVDATADKLGCAFYP